MLKSDEKTTTHESSRRKFVKNAALGMAAFTIVPRHVLGKGYVAPSDTLYIAAVGVGGKGESDIDGFFKSGKAKIAFLCDVDQARAARTYGKYPDAKRYVDWREMFDKESKNFDAVSVSTPDHTHAVVGSAAITLGKHIWIQKPLSHDIYEARVLADLAKKHKVVSQMGNQGSSNNGVREMMEWYEADLIGDVHTVYCWTNRPIWPQGIPWPSKTGTAPSTLNWDLWQGTAPNKPYPAGFDDGGIKLVPFNWRGWWDYGTGALGDMGAHMLEAPFTVLNLQHVSDVEASVGTVYVDESKQGFFPDSCPPSSYAVMTFPKTSKTKGPIKLHWMDGGIQPPRPEELGPAEQFGFNNGGNGILFIGTKGKMMADTYAGNARLLPTSRMNEINVPQKYKRVPGGASGHYAQWVEASIAGYGKMEVSSPFERAALLTEAMLMANLAIRGQGLFREETYTPPVSANAAPGTPAPTPRVRKIFPARTMLTWDAANMTVTNVPEVNQFIKREYRAPWKLSGV